MVRTKEPPMRVKRFALTTLAIAALAAPAAGQSGGILHASDYVISTQDSQTCMMSAHQTLLGAGLVIQVVPGRVVGSNEDRTISIRCDIPGFVVLDDVFFPGEPRLLETVIDAFLDRRPVALLPAAVKAHQYTVDCFRPASCEIDPAAVCRQAYETSEDPKVSILSEKTCTDDQGSYVCGVDYDLNCN